MSIEAGKTDRFSAEALGMLHAAGWHPGRRVADEQLQQYFVRLRDEALEVNGVQTRNPYSVIFPAAFYILREFAGLYLRPVSDPKGDGFYHAFLLDPARDDEWSWEWLRYEWSVGLPLYPLGVCGLFSRKDLEAFEKGLGVCDLAMICVDPTGRIYGIYWMTGEVFLAADTFEQAIEILVRHEFKEHPLPGGEDQRWDEITEIRPQIWEMIRK